MQTELLYKSELSYRDVLILTKYINWIFKNMSYLGQFFLGVAALIALFQTQGIIDDLLEIKEAVNLLRTERKESQASKIASTQDPVDRKDLFVASIKSDKDNPSSGELYLSEKDYNEALNVLKNNSASEQKKFLTKNLKIWDHKSK